LQNQQREREALEKQQKLEQEREALKNQQNLERQLKALQELDDSAEVTPSAAPTPSARTGVATTAQKDPLHDSDGESFIDFSDEEDAQQSPRVLTPFQNRRGPAQTTPATTGATTAPHTESSSDLPDEDEASAPLAQSLTNPIPLSNRKRRNSEPLELTSDDLQVAQPKFSSFRGAAVNNPNTSVPKREYTDTAWTFRLGQFLRMRRYRLEALPSLADKDGHSIPPILPVASNSMVLHQITVGDTSLDNVLAVESHLEALKAAQAAQVLTADSATNPEDMQNRNVVSEAQNGEEKATEAARAITAGVAASMKDDQWRSFTKIATGTQLATIPEDSAVQSEDTPDSTTKQKGEGYGFDYSDFSSSDEEGDANPSLRRKFHLDPPQSTPLLPPRKIITPNTSFDDMMVMRDIQVRPRQTFFSVVAAPDVGRAFNYLNPTNVGCTHARIDDTIRIKKSCQGLLKFAESERIFHALSNRLERMIRNAVDAYEKAAAKAHERSVKKRKTNNDDANLEMPSVHACAIMLHDCLVKYKDDRIETGECKDFIQHELQWAKWFVEASRVGVFHLKVRGCRCRPEWETLKIGDEEEV
jgi:hypothetical protein